MSNIPNIRYVILHSVDTVTKVLSWPEYQSDFVCEKNGKVMCHVEETNGVEWPPTPP